MAIHLRSRQNNYRPATTEVLAQSENSECDNVNYQRFLAAGIALLVSCIASVSVQACEVHIQVRNSSTFTIVAIEVRRSGPNAWSPNLIPGDLAPNGTPQIIVWDGDGDYEIGIEFTNTRQPIIIPAHNICGKSQLIASPQGVVIR